MATINSDHGETYATWVEPIHVATVKIANAREDRDDAIREAYAFGIAVTVLANAAGVSRQRIWQIVNGKDA